MYSNKVKRKVMSVLTHVVLGQNMSRLGSNLGHKYIICFCSLDDNRKIIVAWDWKHKKSRLPGTKNIKNCDALGGKKRVNNYDAIVQSVHSFPVSVILNRMFHYATVCFWQADIYRVAKEVGIMISLPHFWQKCGCRSCAMIIHFSAFVHSLCL